MAQLLLVRHGAYCYFLPVTESAQLLRDNYKKAGFTHRSLANALGLQDHSTLQNWFGKGNRIIHVPEEYREELADLVFGKDREKKQKYLSLAISEKNRLSNKFKPRELARYKQQLERDYLWHIDVRFSYTYGHIEQKIVGGALNYSRKLEGRGKLSRYHHISTSKTQNCVLSEEEKLLDDFLHVYMHKPLATVQVWTKKELRPKEDATDTKMPPTVLMINSDQIGFLFMYSVESKTRYPKSEIIPSNRDIESFVNFCIKRGIDAICWLEILRQDVNDSLALKAIKYQDRKQALVDVEQIEYWKRNIADALLWMRNENDLEGIAIASNLRRIYAEMKQAQLLGKDVITARGLLLRKIDQAIVTARNYVSNLHT